MGLSKEDKDRLLSMPNSIMEIVEASLNLEEGYYKGGVAALGPMFFKLRKSLEGVWGHELPEPDYSSYFLDTEET
jgi:hypothetical protein